MGGLSGLVTEAGWPNCLPVRLLGELGGWSAGCVVLAAGWELAGWLPGLLSICRVRWIACVAHGSVAVMT